MSDPIRSAVHELFASRESTLRGTSFAADARARGLIRRRRAARQAGTIAGVLVGVVALGVGAMAAVDHGTVGPSSRPGVAGVITLDIAGDTTFAMDGVLPGCGEAAPVTVLRSGGFAFEPMGRSKVTAGNTAGSEARLMGDVVSDSANPVSVAINGPAGVIVKDGVVVGYTSWTPEAFATLERGDTARVSSTVGHTVTVCVDGLPATKEFLPAGTYDIYPVIHVIGSREAAAWRVLREGHALAEPGNELLPAGYPGSPFCEDIIATLAEDLRFNGPGPGGNLPYECTDGSVIDISAGTITVPYPGKYFTGDVDAILIGEPVEVTLVEGYYEN
ncbi:MAG: hypothetical protein CVT64_00610 [Actinobacteria bacterium HGW-Actinobacteria-4]|nr:MAG: hypothetical protein CVT64_00610 [Actinobacteria bacterium HGW-Actinobacteria-4]